MAIPDSVPSVRPVRSSDMWSVCPSVRPLFCQVVSLSVRPSIRLSVRPYVRALFSRSVCLSVCPDRSPPPPPTEWFPGSWYYQLVRHSRPVASRRLM